jgi:hypothetical protein
MVRLLNVALLGCLSTIPLTWSWNMTIRANPACQLGGNSVELHFTGSEFIDEFKNVFIMSDGSAPTTSGSRSNEDVVKYTESLMAGIGITTSMDGDVMHMSLCREKAMHVYMLATLGNLVQTPTDKTPANGVGSVVVDSFTGKLGVVPPYAILRASFLEALLVIAIAAIVRLSIIRIVHVETNPRQL